jgi:aminoglycoside 3-N-acetyltransferase
MHTESSLISDLQRFDLGRADILVLHSGYRALRGVEGGPAAVVRALRAALGPTRTLIAPTFTTQLIHPDTWPTPPPPETRPRIVDEMPCFEPSRSTPHKMGAIAEAVWRAPGAIRSDHPVTSWSAIGPRAVELTRDHPIDDPEGIDGPVGRAYRADARVMLLGCGHDADTTIHLAECLLEMPHLLALPDRYPARGADGEREWRPVRKTTKCSDGFVKIEPRLERAGVIQRGLVGDAAVQLIRARDIVRVAVDLLRETPPALLCDDPECIHCPTSRRVLEGWRAPGVELLE